MLSEYLPSRINHGPWVTAHTLYDLRRRDADSYVLPICSLGTPRSEIGRLGELVLPPLFHEALDESLKSRIVARIRRCFPKYDPHGENVASEKVQAVEVQPSSESAPSRPKILAFSVDTAVEEHGPHLPLATDTIQSYGVLNQLAREFGGFLAGPPLEYGQLTWGLPFGFSVDLTAELLTEYVAKFTDAVVAWCDPEAVYVVDVHGSIVHRRAIVEGLRKCGFNRWAFRWLHEPLAEFASGRGDQHAGGVETALVEHVSSELLDPDWWPARIDEISAGQMSFEKAVELTPDLPAFAEHVEAHSLNGIVGDILNYRQVDATQMFAMMMDVARQDVDALLAGRAEELQGAGDRLW
jgi:creatinine amidohydrolase